MGWLDRFFPSRCARRAEQEHARADAELTAQRELDADRAIREARAVAARLARHRRENHFAQRMRAAYEGDTSA